MKVLLALPPVQTGVDRFLTSSVNSPHLGLAYLAAILKRAGIGVQIIDASVEGLTSREFGKIVAGINPDLIGITAFTQQVEEAGRAAKIIKGFLPNVPIIAGGCHPTALARQTLEEFPGFDLVVQGEGELTFLELVKAFKEGKSTEGIPGVGYRKDGDIQINPSRPFLQDLDGLPFPAFELFPLKRYPSAYRLLGNYREIPIQTARGCPYSCNFCFKMMGSRVRSRSLDSVLEEIKYRIGTLPVRRFLIMDENFTLSRERTLGFCDRVRREGISDRVSFGCQTRVDLVDRELLQALKGAGIFLIIYGAESGAGEVLARSKKAITHGQVETAVKLAREAGIKVQLDYIIGHPDETREDIGKSLKMALRLNPDFLAWARMVPYPGTELFNQVGKGENDPPRFPWSDYQTQFKSGFGTRYLDPDVLEWWQIYGYLRFYFRAGRIVNLFRITRLEILFRFFLYQAKRFFGNAR